jgi:glutaredoxin
MLVMKTVIFYTKPDCGLCAEAEKVLQQASANVAFNWITIDITQDEAAFKRYVIDIPVVEIDGEEHARHHINERDFLGALTS